MLKINNDRIALCVLAFSLLLFIKIKLPVAMLCVYRKQLELTFLLSILLHQAPLKARERKNNALVDAAQFFESNFVLHSEFV